MNYKSSFSFSHTHTNGFPLCLRLFEPTQKVFIQDDVLLLYTYHTIIVPPFHIIIFFKLLQLLCNNIFCVTNCFNREKPWLASMGSLSSFEQEFSLFFCLYHTPPKKKKVEPCLKREREGQRGTKRKMKRRNMLA